MSPAPGDAPPHPLATFHRVVAALVLLGSLAALGLAAWLEPDPRGVGTHEQLGFLPCGVLLLTGYPCPSCGMTTSFALAAHLRPLEAFLNQPFGFVLFVLTLCYVPVSWWGLYRGRPILEQWLTGRGRWAFLGLLLLFLGAWVYKVLVVRGVWPV